MPFITSFSKDPIGDLSSKFDENKRRQDLRNEALYGLRLPGLMGIGMNQVPNPYSNDRLGALEAQTRANNLLKGRLNEDIGPLSYDMLRFPDEYLLKTPEKRSQMAEKTRQLANNVMAGLGMLASFGVPASLGAGLLTRGLTGAALNTGLSVPIYRADPDTADPLLDAAMGAGIGMAGLPGMLIGGLLGYTPEIDADQEVPRRYAGGGIVKGGLSRMAKYLKDEEPYRKGIANIIKEKGGNWLTGDVEGFLSPLETVYAPHGNRFSAEQQEFLAANPDKAALNNWIKGPLTKYVKSTMGTAEDPIRALMDQGIAHTQLENFPEHPTKLLKSLRTVAGFPEKPVASTPLGKKWENLTDARINFSTPEEVLSTDPSIGEKNPWIEKLSPDTQIHQLLSPEWSREDLGFDHLIDELHNAMDPESGLPKNLQLTVDQLNQMGIEKAVRHVAKINEYRAKKMENAAAASMKDIPVVKEYPEGYKWVELKGKDPKAFEQENLHLGPEEWNKAMAQFRKDRYDQLEKWLREEGDAMGHCVGGYCDEVLEGRSRIFSLRDEKGRPHVTIETTNSPGMISGEELMRMDPTIDWDRDVVAHQGHLNLPNWVKENRPDLWKQLPKVGINQIKGKSNLRPKDEYLPFVQDFVKTQGPWGDVGDLENSGLFLRSSLPEGERSLMQELGDYLNLEDIKKLREGKAWTPLDRDPEFAEGGLVENPAHEDLLKILESHKPNMDELMQGIPLKFANGGIVRSPEILKIVNECGGKYES